MKDENYVIFRHLGKLTYGRIYDDRGDVYVISPSWPLGPETERCCGDPIRISKAATIRCCWDEIDKMFYRKQKRKPVIVELRSPRQLAMFESEVDQ